MSDPTAFSSDTPTEVTPNPEVTPQVPTDNLFSDQLANIKNERGEQKYDSVQKALEALQHSQEFIPQLQTKMAAQEEELNKLKEAVAKSEAVEDVVSRLTASQDDTATTVQGLDEEATTALIEKVVEGKAAQKIAEDNFSAVNTALVDKFGSPEAANKIVIEKAKELGTTPEKLGELASANPKMVLALFGTSATKVTGAPPTETVNSDGLVNQAPKEGLQRPDKSLLSGASYKDQLEYMKQIQADVYKKFGVET